MASWDSQMSRLTCTPSSQVKQCCRVAAGDVGLFCRLCCSSWHCLMSVEKGKSWPMFRRVLAMPDLPHLRRQRSSSRPSGVSRGDAPGLHGASPVSAAVAAAQATPLWAHRRTGASPFVSACLMELSLDPGFVGGVAVTRLTMDWCASASRPCAAAVYCCFGCVNR